MSNLTFIENFFVERGIPKPDWAEDFSEFIEEELDKETEVVDYKDREDTTHLEGLTLGINYVNSDGISSERIIEIKRVIKSENGNYSLFAYCFVRERVRQFRIDRITNIFNEDGECLDVKGFFEQFEIAYDPNIPPPPKPGAEIRKQLKYKLPILVALARVDNQFCENELNNIISYSVREVENKGLIQSDEAIENFSIYVKNLYPTQETIKKCISKIERFTPSGKSSFLQQCISLIESDGKSDTAELEFIMELQNQIEIENL